MQQLGTHAGERLPFRRPSSYMIMGPKRDRESEKRVFGSHCRQKSWGTNRLFKRGPWKDAIVGGGIGAVGLDSDEGSTQEEDKVVKTSIVKLEAQKRVEKFCDNLKTTDDDWEQEAPCCRRRKEEPAW